MKSTNKKGFALVELLVVIAIVAILATVLVIGYTTFLDQEEQLPTDQQAVADMNDALENLNEREIPGDLKSLYKRLSNAGFTAEDYQPLNKDHSFVWDKKLNRVLLVKENKVVYPEEYASANSKNWYNLKSVGIEPGSDPTISADGAVSVGTASELVSAFENQSDISVLTLTSDINLMGSSAFIPTATTDLVIDGGGKTIYNLVSNQYATVSSGKEYMPATNLKCSSALIGEIPAGVTVTIKNVKIDGLFVGDYDISMVGILVGSVKGNLILENVTINNCAVYGQNKIGIVAGYIHNESKGGNVEMNNVKINNCTVNTSEGEAGMVFGVIADNASVKLDAETCKVNNTVVNTVLTNNHSIITINGVQYIAMLDGDGNMITSTVDKRLCYVLCKVPSKNAYGYKCKVYSKNYTALNDPATYCTRLVKEAIDFQGLID